MGAGVEPTPFPSALTEGTKPTVWMGLCQRTRGRRDGDNLTGRQWGEMESKQSERDGERGGRVDVNVREREKVCTM